MTRIVLWVLCVLVAQGMGVNAALEGAEGGGPPAPASEGAFGRGSLPAMDGKADDNPTTPADDRLVKAIDAAFALPKGIVLSALPAEKQDALRDLRGRMELPLRRALEELHAAAAGSADEAKSLRKVQEVRTEIQDAVKEIVGPDETPKSGGSDRGKDRPSDRPGYQDPRHYHPGKGGGYRHNDAQRALEERRRHEQGERKRHEQWEHKRYEEAKRRQEAERKRQESQHKHKDSDHKAGKPKPPKKEASKPPKKESPKPPKKEAPKPPKKEAPKPPKQEKPKPLRS